MLLLHNGTVSLSLYDQYSVIHKGVSSIMCGHPAKVVPYRACSSRALEFPLVFGQKLSKIPEHQHVPCPLLPRYPYHLLDLLHPTVVIVIHPYCL